MLVTIPLSTNKVTEPAIIFLQSSALNWFNDEKFVQGLSTVSSNGAEETIFLVGLLTLANSCILASFAVCFGLDDINVQVIMIVSAPPFVVEAERLQLWDQQLERQEQLKLSRLVQFQLV